ncbi:YceI family protein [Psychroserpens sp. MEBiC05023]
MKNLLYLLFVLSFTAFSQNKYITKTGTIDFEASVPSFEKVAAKSNSATAIMNVENGDIAALLLIKSFRFKNALMEEHFNENYAESDRFPKATFKGTIEEFDNKNIQTAYVLNGTLTFHGKSKYIEQIAIEFQLNNDTIVIKGNFKTKASDFSIDIPKIVRNKISEDIIITFDFELKQKK